MIIRTYRQLISPITHYLGRSFYGPSYACRYHPTCSQYFSQAIKKYGIIHGGLIGLTRILRCHPYSNHPQIDPLR